MTPQKFFKVFTEMVHDPPPNTPASDWRSALSVRTLA